MHPPKAAFPDWRPRRLRRTPALRAMVAENVLSPADLIWPVFLCEGENERQPVASMPGVERVSVDLIAEKAAGAA